VLVVQMMPVAGPWAEATWIPPRGAAKVRATTTTSNPHRIALNIGVCILSSF
jgi:hypothetical protein